MMKLIAKDGYVYCNGYTYGKEIVLPVGADVNEWTEMTEAEAEALIEENLKAEEDESIQ